MNWKQLFFSGSGRVGRRDFWLAVLLLVVLATPLRLLGAVGELLSLAFLFPHVCLFAKRLHDLGKNGWWAAAQYAPLLGVGLAIGLTADDAGDPPPIMALVAAVILIGTVVFFFRTGLAKGSPEPNAYGDPQPSLFGRKDAEAGRPA